MKTIGSDGAPQIRQYQKPSMVNCFVLKERVDENNVLFTNLSATFTRKLMSHLITKITPQFH